MLEIFIFCFFETKSMQIQGLDSLSRISLPFDYFSSNCSSCISSITAFCYLMVFLVFNFDYLNFCSVFPPKYSNDLFNKTFTILIKFVVFRLLLKRSIFSK
jgi:hypothetical protein